MFWLIIEALFQYFPENEVFWICDFNKKKFLEDLKNDSGMERGICSLQPDTTLAEGTIDLVESQLSQAIKEHLYTKIKLNPPYHLLVWSVIENLLRGLKDYLAKECWRRPALIGGR